MSDRLRVSLFKHGSREFMQLLGKSSIPIGLRRHDPGPVASGEIIEIVKVVGGVSIIPSLAAIIVQWLKNRASREVMIQTDDDRIVHLKGHDLDVGKIEDLLDVAKSANIIQTKPDNDGDA